MEPEEIEYLKTTCDNCKQKIEFPEELYDEQITCPTCQANIKAIPDDQKVDPEQDREWLEGGLLEEQQEGMIAEDVSEAVKLEMLKAQAETGYGAIFDLIAEKFPNLLTQDGQRRLEEERIEYDKSRRMKEFAPPVTIKKMPPRLEGERDATEKQINFLRDLGVRDESTLTSLGIKQARDLIAKILEERDKAGI